jgi:hypothetical protein
LRVSCITHPCSRGCSVPVAKFHRNKSSQTPPHGISPSKSIFCHVLAEPDTTYLGLPVTPRLPSSKQMCQQSPFLKIQSMPSGPTPSHRHSSQPHPMPLTSQHSVNHYANPAPLISSLRLLNAAKNPVSSLFIITGIGRRLITPHTTLSANLITPDAHRVPKIGPIAQRIAASVKPLTQKTHTRA